MILSFYAFLGVVLQQTAGHYDPGAVLSLGIAGAVLAAWAAGRNQRMWPATRWLESERSKLGWLAFIVVGFAAIDLYWPGLVYPASAERLQWLRLGLGLQFAGAAATAAASIYHRPRWLALAVGATFVLTIAVRTLTLYVSPQPFIDVFTLTNQAADYVLAGLNPYRQHYTDIYQGLYGYAPGANYTPVYYYWSALFRLVGDIRWGSIAGDVLAAAGLWCLGRRLGLPARFVALFTLAWLVFPAALFVEEQAWIEPAIAGLTAVTAWALQAGRGRLGGLLLGVLAGFKQHMPLAAGMTLLFLWLRGERRLAAQAGQCALGCFIAGLMPLVLSDPRTFWEQAVMTYLERGLRPDSLSMPAWLANEAGIVLSNGPLMLLALAAMVAGCLTLLIAFKAGWQAWAAALTVAYGGLFYFGKQAFCNYYYLVSFYVLLAALFQAAESRPIHENQ